MKNTNIPWEKWEIDFLLKNQIPSKIKSDRNHFRSISTFKHKNPKYLQTILDFVETEYISNKNVKMQILQNILIIDHLYPNCEKPEIQFQNSQIEKYYKGEIDAKQYRKSQNIWIWENEEEFWKNLEEISKTMDWRNVQVDA